MKSLILFAIKSYKKHISPYTGYSCSYRIHTGHASCSSLGYRAVKLYGVCGGLKVIRQRLIKCGVVHRRYSGFSSLPQKQSGYCDIPCDLDCHDSSCLGDILSGCNPCDIYDLFTSKKNRDDEDKIYIPPNSKT